MSIRDQRSEIRDQENGNRNKPDFKLSILTLSLLAGFSLSAAAAETETAELGDIVVTASGSAQYLKNAPASVTVINQQKLKEQPATRLEEMLQDVPGVNVSGSNVNKSDISIRGLPPDYTLIMVDGKRQNTRESRPNGNGGFEGGFVPPVGAISRIEVIRGPMSSLYGSDAMGGVVNIITKESAQEWNGAVSLGGTLHDHSNQGDGYHGSFFVSGPLIQNKLGVQLYGGGNLRQEDKFVGGYNKNNNKNINAKFTFTPNEKHKFVLDAGRNTQKKTETSGKSLAAFTCRGSSCTPNSSSTTIASRNHWGLSYFADWDVLRSELSVYQERARRQVKYFTTGYNNRQPEITNSVIDAKFMLPLPRNLLVFGGQYQHAKLEDDSVKSVTRVTRAGVTRSTANFSLTENKAIQKSLFLEDEITLTEKWLVTLGARLDHHEKYGSHWNPRFYSVYHLNDNFTFKGGISRAFKAPSIREVSEGYVTSTQNGAGVIYGNPNLKPETSLNEEIGVSYEHDSGFNLSAVLFNTDFKNKLTSYYTGKADPITGANLYIYDNVGKANIKGAELSSHIPLPARLALDLTYTFQHSKRKTDEDQSSSGKSLKGYPLDNTPKHAASAKLTWEATDKLSAYTRLHYQGKQIWANQRNGDNKNIARYRSAYSTVDLGVNYQFNKNLSLNVAVLNVGNERSDVINTDGGNWAREDGRRYWANLNLSF